MPSLLNVKITGAKELDRALRQLPKGTSRSVLRTTLRRVAKPVVDDAKRRAPRSDDGGEHMADTITVGTISARQRGQSRSIGGVLLGIGPTSDQRHAHLVEFGTGVRISDSGKSSGRMPARPFMRPAWNVNRRRVFRNLSRELWLRLEKTAARFAKQAAGGRIIRGLR